MRKKKRNHFVPQAYLRAFASDTTRRKIWTFPNDAGEPRLRPIEKVAVKFYLYAPAGPAGRDYSFEDKLAQLEQFFGSPVWQAAGTAYVDLMDKPLRKMISLLAAVMYLRSPVQFEFWKSQHASIVDLISQDSGPPDQVEINGKTVDLDKESWPAYRDASEDDLKRMWLKQVGGATWLAKIFLEMRWSVMCSEEPIFITTDNPVTPIHKDLRFRGFRNPETSVMFPLSPTRLLWLDHRHREPAGQYYPANDPGATNVLLWRNATANWFSHRDPHLVCAEIVQSAERMGYA